ncbi:unnamed protein product [Caenorhabditis angaria]|uniref:[heparan sulfate]-glucosamine N-sulfotransferase n=1 Tax=Caenorhabditis angaria TaxID=860376 RepID=A0A9P1N5A0_9PELO|nr:unnamed protein product [Caenorhabditis angaria]
MNGFINHRFLRFIKYLLIVLSIFAVYSLIIPSKNVLKERGKPKYVENYKCPADWTPKDEENWEFHQNNGTDQKVLLISDSLFSRHGKLITQVLTALKIPFKSEAVSKNIPVLTTSRKGRYSLIIIENYYKYLNMPRWNRQLLDKYCMDYKVPVISFIASKPNDQLKRIRIKGSSLWMWQNQQIQSLSTHPSKIHKITKENTTRLDVGNSSDWVVFEENTKKFETILSGKVTKNGKDRAVVIHDIGIEDGVNRILFGRNISDWTIKMTFIDSIWWAIGKNMQFSLDRFIQVDIDDIFVGAQGTRMLEDDVINLLAYQQKFRNKYNISNFHFMLGFSGSYFRNGDENEDKGDELLIEKASNFVWFPHMWRHNHAHEHNYTYLEAFMVQNKMFAENMRLPVNYTYAIAPQHDGVYPVHEQLYDAWKKVWKVSVTATEEYPHFKPSTSRKAFIYKNISVLPRQTCGLYTHTQTFDTYPGGFDYVQNLIRGGDLFFTVLLNPVSIFMTHQQNYAHDRLALYTFENLFEFLRCWTNLKIKWQSPIESAKMYFERFEEEKVPLWTNPCIDPRHRIITPPSINCSNLTLPNLLILGPQKTGSTALANFLEIHPNVSQNSNVPGSFEEVQFFGGNNYKKGIEWYLSYFQQKAEIVFEKSATYFDNPLAAKQASALVPNSKLIIILQNPADRAYSWFQHMLAHKDETAMNLGNMTHIFEVSKNNTLAKKLLNRCVSGGKYIHHLEKWLEHFSLSQIMFIDSDVLRNQPIKILSKVTEWLDLPYFDYSKVIRFSPSKGFHCKIDENSKTRCLGESKGRKYEKMDEATRLELDEIFAIDNSALFKFLRKSRLEIPGWLRKLIK